MTTENSIEIIEKRIKDLPLIDIKVFDVISLLNSPESNFEQIVEKLSPDLAARFLNMANSAYYGTEVRSINHAVRLLGYREMKHILITSILLDHFTSRLKHFSFDKFQRQAQFCAAVSRILGQIFDYEKREDLFTVAILHNIGKLVIAVYFKDEHREIIALKESESIPTSEAEQKVLGVGHAEIGALVLGRFNIPKDICDAVRFHHTEGHEIPEESDFQLEFISRESAKIVGDFKLPEETEASDIVGLLDGAVAEGKEIQREMLKTEMRAKGYREVFPDILNQASRIVRSALRVHLKERVFQEAESLDILR
jgi:HD-like signal output (HDOD) protein